MYIKEYTQFGKKHIDLHTAGWSAIYSFDTPINDRGVLLDLFHDCWRDPKAENYNKQLLELIHNGTEFWYISEEEEVIDSIRDGMLPKGWNWVDQVDGKSCNVWIFKTKDYVKKPQMLAMEF
jgi:hypothetical protein